MKKILMIATALTTSAYTFSSGATQEAASPVLQSLPAKVQKYIEEMRTSCKDIRSENPKSRCLETKD